MPIQDVEPSTLKPILNLNCFLTLEGPGAGLKFLDALDINIQRAMDVFVGGVKERPIAYKLGIGFCDHNHERKEALAGFEGMLNFAREVYSSVMSPVWRFVPRHTKNNIKEAS